MNNTEQARAFHEANSEVLTNLIVEMSAASGRLSLSGAFERLRTEQGIKLSDDYLELYDRLIRTSAPDLGPYIGRALSCAAGPLA